MMAMNHMRGEENDGHESYEREKRIMAMSNKKREENDAESALNLLIIELSAPL